MQDHIVRTVTGAVRGARVGPIVRFLGIPYAGPPVGARRFAPPEPPAPWQGVRDALEPGPNAPQKIGALPGLDLAPLVGDGWRPGDDYLTLNLWKPAGDASGLPVMVFIHGGGFVIGSKDAPVTDGRNFARDGVICVAINYRMGTEGFLPIPGIPANLGLRDQIAALQWVRENIAAFGGDPGNVTVFGESAGAMSIAALMVSPLASGLFRRAIVQSGHGAMTRRIDIARRLVRKLAKILRIAPVPQGYRSLDSGAMLDGVERVGRPTTWLDLRDEEGREPLFGISRFAPVHGDDVLPVQPLEALKAGAGRDVDLLIGTNAEEMNLYLVPLGLGETIGRWLATYIVHRSQPQARRILSAYGMGRKGVKPGQAFAAAMHDLVFRWPARRFAEEHRGRTHMYEFDWRSPQYGAAHGIELPFVFDTLDVAAGPRGLWGDNPPQALAERVHRVWIEFARDGGLPWPEFTREARHVRRLEQDETILEPPMPVAPWLP